MTMHVTLDGESFELTPELVRSCVDGHTPEDVRSYWVYIDGIRWPVKQVISLATGVTERQRFQSQSSRRWLQNLGFTIGSGNAAVAGKPPSGRTTMTSQRSSLEPAVQPGRKPDIVLIGCAKTKRPVAAEARDLYTSDYFLKMRRYAETSGVPWYILSAKHGLVAPNDWVEPYDLYLPDTSRDYRRTWAQKVGEQLEHAAGSLSGKLVEVHAGSAYVDAIGPVLRALGADLQDRLEGLSIGRRLSWYLQHENQAGIEIGAAVLDRLGNPSSSMTLADVLATGGEGLKSPGLYSWWVDEAGAEDLSRGVGHDIQPGLIYAGLAGATRSGGSKSTNTLWGRIATMHLGKKHEFSTLRRSLGSILAAESGQPLIDEVELTRWMHAHLRVVTIPVADPDTLNELESLLLKELDPPLNLAKVPKAPLRAQLSALRKQFGTGQANA